MNRDEIVTMLVDISSDHSSRSAYILAVADHIVPLINNEMGELELFHPRAMKLMKKKKPFIVIADDEPYFSTVYSIIREHEKAKGRWTKVDETEYILALGGVER